MVLERNLQEEQEHLYQAETELEEWKNQKDPEPEQPDCVKANRELLKEKKIPYFQFYKTIEFDQILEEERRNHLEEALLEMGILDALIVPNPDKPEKLFLFSTPCVILKKKGVFICYSLINTLIKFMASLPVMTA